MMDWTQKTDNPVDKMVCEEMLEFLQGIRRIQQEGKAIDYVLEQIRDKAVLDIGVCEHTLEHMRSPDWKHRKIKNAASRVVGIDVLPGLVEHLNREGFTVHCVDATSEAFIGERFDAVVIGDVIEHVDNPVALLRFAKRHVKPDGKVYVSTPNPFYKNNFKTLLKQGTLINNFEHVSWISPTMALEIGRRAELGLANYVCFINRTRILKNRLRRRPVSEIHTADYLYVYRPSIATAES